MNEKVKSEMKKAKNEKGNKTGLKTSKITQNSKKLINFRNNPNVFIKMNGGDSNKKVSKKSKILLGIVATILVLLVFIFNFIKERFINYNNYLSNIDIVRSINVSRNNRDFLSSAQQYHDLVNSVDKNKYPDSFILFSSMEAQMYYFHIVCSKKPNTSETDMVYINRILAIARDVKNLAKNYSLFYYFALAIESDCYHLLETPLNDEKLAKNIAELESFTESNSVDWNSYESPIIFAAVYATLSQYYKLAALTLQMSNPTSPNLSLLIRKMEKYREKYDTFVQELKHDTGVSVDPSGYPILRSSYDNQLSLIFSQLMRIFISENPENLADAIKKIENIIDDCYEKIEHLDYDREQHAYVGFHRLIVKALYIETIIYRTLGGTGKLNEKSMMNECSQKCQDIATFLLRLPYLTDEDAIYELAYACNYMIMNDRYTEEDVKYFYENELRIIKTDRFKNLSFADKKNENILLSNLCREILKKYGYNGHIYDLGVKCVKDLESYLVLKNSQVTDYEKKNIRELYLYFNEYKSKSVSEGNQND